MNLKNVQLLLLMFPEEKTDMYNDECKAQPSTMLDKTVR